LSKNYVKQTLFKNFFDPINLSDYADVFSLKGFIGTLVNRTLRYRQINLFTTSALREN